MVIERWMQPLVGQIRGLERPIGGGREAADTDPLVGMALLYGHDMRMQMVEGGSVSIEALP